MNELRMWFKIDRLLIFYLRKSPTHCDVLNLNVVKVSAWTLTLVAQRRVWDMAVHKKKTTPTILHHYIISE